MFTIKRRRRSVYAKARFRFDTDTDTIWAVPTYSKSITSQKFRLSIDRFASPVAAVQGCALLSLLLFCSFATVMGCSDNR